MTKRTEDTLSSAVNAWRFVQRNWPFAARTSPLAYAAIAGVGLAAGIGAGLLFAPQSGVEFRASLSERTKGLLASLGARVEGAAVAVEDEIATVEEGAGTRNGGSHSRRHAAKHARA